MKNVKFRLSKQGQVVSMQDMFTTAKTSTWQHKTLVWAKCEPAGSGLDIPNLKHLIVARVSAGDLINKMMYD